MQFGICNLSLIPLKKEPSHQSEQVSQLLLGDTYEIVSKQGDWTKIINDYDGYNGWLATNQVHILPDKQYFTLKSAPETVTYSIVSIIKENKSAILAGSRLPYYDDGHFKIDDKTYSFTDKVIVPNDHQHLKNKVRELVLPWLNAPYQWGGRSVFGVDCSGFTQIIFRQLGVKLLRDAYQQAESGEIVNFIAEARCGDIAFFDNDEKKIVHTGILLGNDEIIHASGRVRMDKIDHFGIFNSEKNTYSHHLRMIKRYF